MIKVYGEATLTVRYEVELEVTEEQFDRMDDWSQWKLLEGAIDWYDACRSADVGDIKVWDVEDKLEESA